MKCSKCGEKLKNQGAFCPNCGAEILPKKQNAHKSLSKKAKAVIACVCVVALLISGTVGGLYFFRNHTDNLTGPDSNYISFTEGFTDVPVTDEKSALEAIKSVADVIGIENVEKELKISRTDTIENDTYYRFQQYYNGIPVYGNSLVISVDKNGKTTALTSNYKNPLLKDIDDSSENEKLSNAKDNIEKYLKEEVIQLSAFNEYYFIQGSKMILSYEVIVTTNQYIYRVLINAKNTKVLLAEKAFNNSSSEVQSKDGEVKAIGWQNDDGSYHLYNDENKISVFDFSKVKEKPTSADFSRYGVDTIYSNNNKFDKKGVYLLNYLSAFSNYFSELGDAGFYQIHSAINVNIDTNASGGGIFIEEDGTLHRYGILSVGRNRNIHDIDIIAHEYTHMVTISLMEWQGEQASAINEGFSDIFGEILEENLNGEMDWKHDGRIISDPENSNNKQRYPASLYYLENAQKYKEEQYYINKNQVEDYSHYASTIISHCAYLMWNGIDGKEQSKIDENTLAKIWYRSLFLLQSDATFSQCRNAVELSARSLWKSGKLTEKQYDTVIQAFNEVGIDRVSNYANKTLKNDFNMLVLNSEGKERVSAEIKIYPSATSSDIFFANKDTTVFEATFDSTSPEEGIHINLKDGRYLVEISDTATEKSTEPIGMIIEVDGNSKVATDKMTVYTDFKEITTVILNKDEEESRKDSNTAILSPESAIDIYMANKNIWMFNDEYIPMQRYGYCLLDLDFDGILELIKSANDGSGRYSNNNYYKINLENNSVEEVPSLAEGYGGGYDYYYLGTENIKLLSNKSNDSKFYYCTDYERIMTGDYVTRYGKMYLKDGKIQSDDLFANHQCEARLQGNSEKINEYFYYGIGDGACPDVSEAEYNQFIADFFAENTDLHLVWNCIDGVEFDNADDGTKKQILLDAYRSFSYDGFSFDDLAINHTIKLEDHSKITVTGTMIEESYEIHSENKGTVYILILDKPIEAKLYNEFMGYNGEVKTISSVQVNISKSEYERYKGKEVTLSGNVMIAHTVHHRRDIVLDDCVFE